MIQDIKNIDGSVERLRGLDGRLLLTFLELLECRSATVAAARLGLSQSSVSHSLNRLRQLHDDPLFVRRPHGLEPTATALQLEPKVRATLAAAAALFDEVEFDPRTSRRRFSAAMPDYLIGQIGGPLMTRWAQSAPSISLSLISLATDDLPLSLRRGEVDTIVRPSGAEGILGCIDEPLLSDRFCVAARRPFTPELTVEAYWASAHVWAGRAAAGDGWESISVDRDVALHVPNWFAALSVAASSNLIATCPRSLATQVAEGFGLHLYELPDQRVNLELTLTRRESENDPGLAWLFQELRVTLASVASP